MAQNHISIISNLNSHIAYVFHVSFWTLVLLFSVKTLISPYSHIKTICIKYLPSPTVTSLHKSFNFVSNKAKGQISNFPKNEHFLPPYQRVRNVCFSKNLACLVFLKHPFWDSPFSFITNDLALPPEKKYESTLFPFLKKKVTSMQMDLWISKKNP